MKRLMLILSFAIFSTWVFAQDDTHVVDSLLIVLPTQEGREKTLRHQCGGTSQREKRLSPLTSAVCDVRFAING